MQHRPPHAPVLPCAALAASATRWGGARRCSPRPSSQPLRAMGSRASSRTERPARQRSLRRQTGTRPAPTWGSVPACSPPATACTASRSSTLAWPTLMRRTPAAQTWSWTWCVPAAALGPCLAAWPVLGTCRADSCGRTVCSRCDRACQALLPRPAYPARRSGQAAARAAAEHPPRGAGQPCQRGAVGRLLSGGPAWLRDQAPGAAAPGRCAEAAAHLAGGAALPLHVAAKGEPLPCATVRAQERSWSQLGPGLLACLLQWAGCGR